MLHILVQLKQLRYTFLTSHVTFSQGIFRQAKALQFSRSKTYYLSLKRGEVNPAFNMIEVVSPTHFTEELVWRFGSGHAISLAVYHLMILFLRMNMIENITEDHASISCTTCKGIASLPKGQSTQSWYQQCWQTEVALKTGINNYLHFKKFYVSMCSTLLLSFTYTAKLFKRKTLYCNFHCCSRPKDSVPTREIISKRNYIDLN